MYDWVLYYKPHHHTPITINDGITKKKRKILVPCFQELCIQHLIVKQLEPMFYQGMYEHSYASIPNRGAHKGKKQIEKWIKYDPKNCKNGAYNILRKGKQNFTCEELSSGLLASPLRIRLL